jgi:hypothetical protein
MYTQTDHQMPFTVFYFQSQFWLYMDVIWTYTYKHNKWASDCCLTPTLQKFVSYIIIIFMYMHYDRVYIGELQTRLMVVHI